ncbi:phage portal protein [Spirulina subsalsa FACHB-351]|uniref:Phage portal protein n=1 Tax=Spirulina subsalsa FACHB-351 TaxID=234711 RepID=A0ABT3L5P0_9CYAN|nr:phage portal protein [Spirulina subsalsa]MCW6036816.1 phage portal protein [Spirulina subsalsa FACHB-351]
MRREKPSLLQRALNVAWYATVGMKRSFSAARRSRLTQGWSTRTSAGDANQVIYRDHETLRQRSREQSINSPYIKRYHRLLKQNVIGPKGIQLQSKAELDDGKSDRRARHIIEHGWKRWGRKGTCDVTGRYSWVTFLQLWLETLARDGEVMVRLVRNFPNRYGFAVQILECDRLDLNYNDLLPNGHRVRMGVELDDWERPLAYYLLRDHPGDVQQRQPARGRHERIPASELLHTFEPWRPHQSRGFTWAHAAMLELYHLDEYRKAEMLAAEHGAKLTGFFEQDAEWLEPPDEDEQDAEIEEEIEAGTAKILPYGVKFTPYKSDHPSSNFGPFLKQGLRGTAAGLGPSYNRLAHDLEGVSFSSLRSGELDERDYYKCLQQFVISELLEFVFEAWLEMAMLTGAVSLSFSRIEQYQSVHWQPRGWDWVDPAKDSKAASESIKNRTKTRSYYIRQAGDDPEEVFEELAREEEELREKGLLPPVGEGSTDNPTDPDDDEDETRDAA